jgi:hypothetical protein
VYICVRYFLEFVNIGKKGLYLLGKITDDCWTNSDRPVLGSGGHLITIDTVEVRPHIFKKKKFGHVPHKGLHGRKTDRHLQSYLDLDEVQVPYPGTQCLGKRCVRVATSKSMEGNGGI